MTSEKDITLDEKKEKTEKTETMKNRNVATTYRSMEVGRIGSHANVQRLNMFGNMKPTRTMETRTTIKNEYVVENEGQNKPKEAEKEIPLENYVLAVSEEKEEETATIPEFPYKGIDRATNFLSQKTCSPSEMIQEIESLLQKLSATYKQNNQTFTYALKKNRFHCRVNVDDERCTFDIGIYTYKDNTFIIDVQELCGEHFTFNKVLAAIRSILGEKDIAKIPKFDKRFYGCYGLDMDIGFDSMDTVAKQ